MVQFLHECALLLEVTVYEQIQCICERERQSKREGRAAPKMDNQYVAANVDIVVGQKKHWIAYEELPKNDG